LIVTAMMPVPTMYDRSAWARAILRMSELSSARSRRLRRTCRREGEIGEVAVGETLVLLEVDAAVVVDAVHIAAGVRPV
jgi:hypothetical protein